MSNKKGENVKEVEKIYSFKGDKDIQVQVGYIEDNIYHSRRKSSHFFRKFQGFALSVDVYNKIVNNGAFLIYLYENNKIYESNITQWKHTNHHWNNFIHNQQKIDPQYVLELSEMKTYAYDADIYDKVKGGIKMEEQDLDKIGPVQGTTVDLLKYDKQTTTIEKAEVTQLPSQFTPLIPGTQQHYMQWVLKVSSVVLESIREGEDKIEFRATEVFNLIQDEKGNLKGYPTGEGAKLMKFLKDLKVPSPEHLKSIKEVIEAIKGKTTVIKTETKERDGRTNTYLRFRY